MEAKKFAKEEEISVFDTIEIEPESSDGASKNEIKIAAVRELIRQINLTPGQGKLKLAIIKDADRLNLEAANTLLKTLEEPPKSAKIILLSRDLKLLPTIRSRCQIVRLSDRTLEQDRETIDTFSKAVGGNLKQAFLAAEKFAADKDIEGKIDLIITTVRENLLSNGRLEDIANIKLLIDAKKNTKITTNKRLVLENLFLNFTTEKGI